MSSLASTIDLSNVEGPVYTGRDRGERLRAEYHLDDLDRSAEVVEVKIPENTYTISSSFFLGMFGPSVVRAGSKEAFFRRFHFSTPEYLREAMESYVSRALQSRNLFQ